MRPLRTSRAHGGHLNSTSFGLAHVSPAHVKFGVNMGEIARRRPRGRRVRMQSLYSSLYLKKIAIYSSRYKTRRALGARGTRLSGLAQAATAPHALDRPVVDPLSQTAHHTAHGTWPVRDSRTAHARVENSS